MQVFVSICILFLVMWQQGGAELTSSAVITDFSDTCKSMACPATGVTISPLSEISFCLRELDNQEKCTFRFAVSVEGIEAANTCTAETRNDTFSVEVFLNHLRTPLKSSPTLSVHHFSVSMHSGGTVTLSFMNATNSICTMAFHKPAVASETSSKGCGSASYTTFGSVTIPIGIRQISTDAAAWLDVSRVLIEGNTALSECGAGLASVSYSNVAYEILVLTEAAASKSSSTSTAATLRVVRTSATIDSCDPALVTLGGLFVMFLANMGM